MKTILISGTSGFIGAQLLKSMLGSESLSEYNLVTLSSCKADGVKNIFHKNYTFTAEDFINEDVSSVDIVIHAGAFIPKSGAEVNDVDKCTSNIQGTYHLINSLPNIPSKFIFISTIDVYKPSVSPINELSEVSPSSLYGQSKYYCEKLLESWAVEKGVILQQLRLGHIYGPGEDEYKKLIPVTIRRVINGEAPQLFSSGTEKRSFLYISDLCRMIIRSIELKTSQGPINVVSKNAISVRNIVKHIALLSSQKPEIVELDNSVKGNCIVFDTRKVEKLLGKELVSIEDGLAREYEYFNSKN